MNKEPKIGFYFTPTEARKIALAVSAIAHDIRVSGKHTTEVWHMEEFAERVKTEVENRIGDQIIEQ